MSKLSAGQRHKLAFQLNGRPVEAYAEPRRLLSDALRELGLTGTHVGCEHGVCGACTVQIDGDPARACLTLAIQIEGRHVRTVEALSSGEALTPLQESFQKHHGLQCGFCTPGILMSIDALLRRMPYASEDEIREHLGGHLCRCTGYAPILKAALDSARQAREVADA